MCKASHPRNLWSIAALLVAGACNDGSLPTSVTRAPDAPVPTRAITAAVQVQALSPNSHFFWLPPIVPEPTPTGTFDATLSPEVEICELDGAGTACAATQTTGFPITFTMTTGPVSDDDEVETVQVVPADEHYIANWDTEDFNLSELITYRIFVRVAGTTLGFADVDVVSSEDDEDEEDEEDDKDGHDDQDQDEKDDDGLDDYELRNVDTGEFIELEDDETLPIKFRIEDGAVFVVGSGGGTVTAQGGAVAIDLPAGAVSGDLGITVQPVADLSGIPVEVAALPGSVFDFGPDGTVFSLPATLTLAYDEAMIPSGVPETFVTVYTEANGQWIEVPTVVDLDNKTASAVIDGFSRKAVGVSVGGNWSCALVADGTAYCWGDNFYGNLGDGTVNASSTPVQVLGGPFSELSVRFTHSCGLTQTGGAECWGYGYWGQLGNGVGAISEPTPVQVQGGPYVDLGVGWYHSCALKGDGRAECWGNDDYGQLGSNADQRRTVRPVAVHGAVYAQIAVGGLHTCAKTNSASVECWGFNREGQVGVGSTALVIQTPTPVSGGPYVEVVTGAIHTCALKGDGSVDCWGRGRFGVLGAAGTANSTVPVGAQSGPYVSITAGGSHSCGLTSAGTIECWGRGDEGQLGDGNFQSSSQPVTVQGGPYTAMRARMSTTCAIRVDGEVVC